MPKESSYPVASTLADTDYVRVITSPAGTPATRNATAGELRTRRYTAGTVVDATTARSATTVDEAWVTLTPATSVALTFSLREAGTEFATVTVNAGSRQGNTTGISEPVAAGAILEVVLTSGSYGGQINVDLVEAA